MRLDLRDREGAADPSLLVDVDRFLFDLGAAGAGVGLAGAAFGAGAAGFGNPPDVFIAVVFLELGFVVGAGAAAMLGLILLALPDLGRVVAALGLALPLGCVIPWLPWREGAVGLEGDVEAVGWAFARPWFWPWLWLWF